MPTHLVRIDVKCYNVVSWTKAVILGAENPSHCCEFMKLEYRDVAVYLGAVSLRNTLGDPDDVATFLLLQFDERVEDAKVELLHERILHQLHLQELHRK